MSDVVDKRMFTISKSSNRDRKRIRAEIVSCVLFSFHMMKGQTTKIEYNKGIEGGRKKAKRKRAHRTKEREREREKNPMTHSKFHYIN